MSTLTNLQLDGDGIIENLYYYLWSKDEFNNGPKILLPDTIIYQFSQPYQWYFTNKSGKIMRKSKVNINNVKIEYEMNKNSIGSHVIAYFITTNSNDDDAIIEYFDKNTLKEFLDKTEKPNYGILQKFIQPKGVSNAIVRAIWSPKICLLERRVNIHKLYDNRFNLHEKSVTFEGGDFNSVSEPVKGEIIAGELQRVCNEVVDHIAKVTFYKYKIGRMVLNLKVDSQERAWLLWSTCIRTKNMDPSTQSKILPLKMDCKLKTPKHVQLSSIGRIHESRKFVKNPCGSCGNIIEELTKTCEVKYKAVISHFDHLMRYCNMKMKPQTVQDESVLWPPSKDSIVAAGNVGFGIIDHIDQQVKESTKIKFFRTIPPPLRYIHPTLTIDDYLRYKSDPIFLNKTLKMCENCFLVYADFSTSNLALNALHHNAPTILRPPRPKLDPVFQRRSPSTAWAPVHDNNHKKTNIKTKISGRARNTSGFSFGPPNIPKIPNRVDPKLLSELETGKNYVARPTTSSNTSLSANSKSKKMIAKHEKEESGFNSFEPWDINNTPSYLQRHEEEFFKELYSNPHIDQSHPLSHMIDSASRIKLASKSNTFKKSISTGNLDLKYTKKRASNGKKSNHLKKKIPAWKKNIKSSTVNKGFKKAGRFAPPPSITTSAKEHQEYLLKTLGKVREELADATDLKDCLEKKTQLLPESVEDTAVDEVNGFLDEPISIVNSLNVNNNDGVEKDKFNLHQNIPKDSTHFISNDTNTDGDQFSEVVKVEKVNEIMNACEHSIASNFCIDKDEKRCEIDEKGNDSSQPISTDSIQGRGEASLPNDLLENETAHEIDEYLEKDHQENYISLVAKTSAHNILKLASSQVLSTSTINSSIIHENIGNVSQQTNEENFVESFNFTDKEVPCLSEKNSKSNIVRPTTNVSTLRPLKNSTLLENANRNSA